MKIPSIEENALITSFSSTKKQILLILKRESEIDLTNLSQELGITKMGVLNHIQDLEELDIIERFHKRQGVGRPRLAIRLTKDSRNIFPKAYSSLTCSLLTYIDDNLGRSGVRDALFSRQENVKKKYSPEFEGLDFQKRVEKLSQLRDNDGYMVELKMIPSSDSYELLEYNCPILDVADKYHEACIVEEEFFEEILDANVETTHRTVQGDNVCRFLIKKKT